METTDWLSRVCESPRNLTYFISLLAELESIGAHKIRCSIENHGEDRAWGAPELKHLGEESLHAALFQKLLDRRDVALSAEEKEGLKQIAHDYFDPLDHGTSDHLAARLGGYNAKMCYVLVSYLVECRALEVYEGLCAICPDEGARHVFCRIVEDEKGHLSAMEAALKTSLSQGEPFSELDFKDLEGKLYHNLQDQFIEFIDRRGE